jgi:hypothetical protein
MPTPKANRRGIEPPPELVARARLLVSEHGVRSASRALNLGREATLALAAGATVDRGTLALAERAVEVADAAPKGGKK